MIRVYKDAYADAYGISVLGTFINRIASSTSLDRTISLNLILASP